MSVSSLLSTLSVYNKSLKTYNSSLNSLNAKNLAWDEIDSNLEQLQAKLDVLKSNSFFNSKSITNTNDSIASFTAMQNPLQTTYDVSIYQLAQKNIISSFMPINTVSGSHSILQSSEEINTGFSGVSTITVRPDVMIASGARAMQLDQGELVLSGSFKINGQTIEVTTTDTINSILSKINKSDAGVTAQFDSDSDKIILASNSFDTGQDITLSDDTSGFLSAMKLDDAIVENGTPSDLFSSLSTTSFSDTITNGSFSINNVNFNIDTSRDSIYSLMDKINRSNANVKIEYDSDQEIFVISSKNTGEDISLKDNSGFLNAIGIMDNADDTDDSANSSVYEAIKAQFEINGNYYEQSSNSISVDGSRIDLLASGETTISVGADKQKIKEAISDFVNQFNTSMNLINRHLQGVLKKDSALTKLSAELTSGIKYNFTNSGSIRNMSQMGISLEKSRNVYTGRITFNENYFNSKFDTLKDSMAKYFADDADGDGETDDLGYANIVGDYLRSNTDDDAGTFAGKINYNNLAKYQTELNIGNINDKISLINNSIRGTQDSAWIKVRAYLLEVQNALDTLKDKSTFLSNKTSSSNSQVLTASASVDSVQKTYQVFVNNIATAASVTSSEKIGIGSGAVSITGYEEISVHPVSRFDPVANPDALFKYGSNYTPLDSDKRVIAGYFTLNGKNISITGNDSINSVIGKINTSNTGVRAIYDRDSDKLFMSTEQGGKIVFGKDTSGFLDAMKFATLSGNQIRSYVNVEGSVYNKYKSLSQTALSQGDNAVINGSFAINGVNFSVDASTDSLYSIIKRINQSDAGVTADYDEITDTVSITSKELGNQLELGNDTSNFLRKLNLLDSKNDRDQNQGTSIYLGDKAKFQIDGQEFVSDTNEVEFEGTNFNIKSGGNASITVTPDTQKAADAIKTFVDKFNYEMSVIDYYAKGDLKGNSDLAKIRSELFTKATSLIENSGSLTKLYDAGIGIEKYRGKATGKLKLFTPILQNALNTNREDVWKLFADDADNDGQADDRGFAVNTDSYFDPVSRENGSISSKISADNLLNQQTVYWIRKKEISLVDKKDELQRQYNTLSKTTNLSVKQTLLLNNLAFQIKSLSNYKFNVLR